MPSQAGKLAVITGANRGLGLEMALALAGADAKLVLACRDVGKGEQAKARILERHPRAEVEVRPLDVADLKSIHRFADEFNSQFQTLDLLIHNAAAIMVPRGQTRDGFETHLGTNHFGPFALTGLLLDRLNAAPGARIVNLSSIAHRSTAGLDPDDPGLMRRPYKLMDAYGRSKLAALLFTFELARRLDQRGLPTKAVAAHPGYSATNVDFGGFFLRLTTRLMAQPPAKGALPALHAATAADVRNGDYFGPDGLMELRGNPRRIDCSAAARDPETARRLWELSIRSTGVRYLDEP